MTKSKDEVRERFITHGLMAGVVIVMMLVCVFLINAAPPYSSTSPQHSLIHVEMNFWAAGGREFNWVRADGMPCGSVYGPDIHGWYSAYTVYMNDSMPTTRFGTEQDAISAVESRCKANQPFVNLMYDNPKKTK